MDVALWVDALQPSLTGIGRYTLELLRGLPADGRIASLAAFGRAQILADPEQLLRGESPKPAAKLVRRWRRWQDRRAVSRMLFHGPNYFLPRFAEHGVITVHDLSVLKFPETHPAERVAQFERELGSSLARASHIITDTETVRREVIEHLGATPAKVTAVPLGISPVFRPRSAGDLSAALAHYDLKPGSYGLCVSTLEPRKKIDRLLSAWRRLPVLTRDNFPLVLIGASGWRNESLKAAIEAGSAEGWLRCLGYVPESDLPCLYAGSRLFAYPSTYEGFGFPPLEAMASGVPAVVSNRSCLPEVCGDAALYIDPDDEDAFLATLHLGLEEEAVRATLIQAGIERAASYTWSRCIERTVDVYSRVLAG